MVKCTLLASSLETHAHINMAVFHSQNVMLLWNDLLVTEISSGDMLASFAPLESSLLEILSMKNLSLPIQASSLNPVPLTHIFCNKSL